MSNSGFQNNAVFWVEVDKIHPNPYQPRVEFDEEALKGLAESIKQYGVLQPLVVTRKEEYADDGSINVYYELISGERRLRASKLAGLTQVPVLIRNKEDSDKEKLELAIIENLQREDLNPIEKAEAFKKLHEEFGMTHAQIAQKIGKSREYVSNAIRLLSLPEDIQRALANGIISEGHSRPLLMLNDKPEEQKALFDEITLKKLTVREAELVARSVASEKVRKKPISPELKKIEKELTESLGTRVRIEQKDKGVGRIYIDFFDKSDLEHLLQLLKAHQEHLPAQYNQKTQNRENATPEPQTNAELALASALGASNITNPDQADVNQKEHIDTIASTINAKYEVSSDLSDIGANQTKATANQQEQSQYSTQNTDQDGTTLDATQKVNNHTTANNANDLDLENENKESNFAPFMAESIKTIQNPDKYASNHENKITNTNDVNDLNTEIYSQNQINAENTPEKFAQTNIPNYKAQADMQVQTNNFTPNYNTPELNPSHTTANNEAYMQDEYVDTEKSQAQEVKGGISAFKAKVASLLGKKVQQDHQITNSANHETNTQTNILNNKTSDGYNNLSAESDLSLQEDVNKILNGQNTDNIDNVKFENPQKFAQDTELNNTANTKQEDNSDPVNFFKLPKI